MKIAETSICSKALGQELDVLVYGEAGMPVVALPVADSSAGSWEFAGLVDDVAQWVEAGELRLICVDSADDRSWLAESSPLDYRAEHAAAYLEFLTHELPDLVGEVTGSSVRPVLAGVGVGATSALAAVALRPAAFSGVLLVGGSYDARELAGGETSEAWEACSPVALIGSLKARTLGSIKKLQLAFVAPCDGVEPQRAVQELLANKGISATFEYWNDSNGVGFWREAVSQLLPAVIAKGGLEARAAEQEAERVRLAKERLAAAENVAAERAQDEHAAEERVATEKAGIEERELVYQTALSAAQAAWEKRNEVAAKLTMLEQRAQRLQAEADAAGRALSDARWFAGEAEAALTAARDARAAADDAVAEARAAI